MDSLISTFHIDWHLIVAQLVNFAVVILVLWRFALKPLGKLMDERGQTIAGGLENAKKQEDLLKAQQAQYDATLAQARAEAATIMKDVKKEAEAKKAEMMEKTQAEVATLITAGKKQLEADKQKMLTEAKAEIVALVVASTEKVIGEIASGKVETKLVEESIKSI